jgi:hypothetical protein
MKFLLSAAAAGAIWYAAQPAMAAKVPLDTNVFSDYNATHDTISFVTCGKLVVATGCFGVGYMSPPFDQACAVLEGTPRQNRNVVTRAIYVLDKRNYKADPVTLYVYTRTDTITDHDDTIQVKLRMRVPLDGVVGGSRSNCFMAANDSFVYAGTDAGMQIGVVDKAGLTVTPVSGPGLLTSITADARGYIAINFQEGHQVAGPSGEWVEEGGGQNYQVSTRIAWKP